MRLPYGSVIFILTAYNEIDGRSLESKGFPQLIFKVTLVGKVHDFRFIAENHEGRRFDLDLGCIKNFQVLALFHGRLVHSHGIGHNLIEDGC